MKEKEIPLSSRDDGVTKKSRHSGAGGNRR